MPEWFGFSYLGAIYLLMLTIPNLIWTRHQPPGYSPENENRILVILERVGQVLVTCFSIITTSLNPAPVGLWNLWLAVSAALMLLYEVCWVRYFRHISLEAMYGSFWGIPSPLASLPVAAFLLLGIYGKSALLVVSVLVLGVGHIGIHRAAYRSLCRQ